LRGRGWHGRDGVCRGDGFAVRTEFADRWSVVREGRLRVDVKGVEMGEYLRVDVMWRGNGQRGEGFDGLDLPVVILNRVLQLWFG